MRRGGLTIRRLDLLSVSFSLELAALLADGVDVPGVDFLLCSWCLCSWQQSRT